MIYAEGNNREAVKFERVEIPILLEPGQPTQGRYYLPELPHIDKGRVVGIQNAYRTTASVGWVQLPNTNYNSFIDGNFSVNSRDILFNSRTTLNLVNNEDQLVIENFPINQLSPGVLQGGLAGAGKMFKIMPFDIKINTKKSYLYFNFTFTPPGPSAGKLIYNLTFFYI